MNASDRRIPVTIALKISVLDEIDDRRGQISRSSYVETALVTSMTKFAEGGVSTSASASPSPVASTKEVRHP